MLTSSIKILVAIFFFLVCVMVVSNLSMTNNGSNQQIRVVRSSSKEIHIRDLVPPTTSHRPLKIFAHDPDRFSASFLQCAFHSPRCHIHYHHVQKTGGSRLASRLHPVLSNPRGVKYESKKWCCGLPMMDRFHENVQLYCEKLKFGIYEVLGPQFADVVKTCMDSQSNNTSAVDRKSEEDDEIVVLMTIREPIQLTLSQIHHQCNKNFQKKSKEEKIICKQCSFESNPDFLKYVNQTNNVYEGIASAVPDILEQFRKVSRYSNSRARPEGILGGSDTQNRTGRGDDWVESILGRRNEEAHRVMILDQADIDRFFSLLEQHSPAGIMVPEGRGNEEKTHVCSFGVTSSMMKALSPALEIYRNLTSGLVG